MIIFPANRYQSELSPFTLSFAGNAILIIAHSLILNFSQLDLPTWRHVDLAPLAL